MLEEKYYTSSDGTRTLLKDVESTHLINGFSKKVRTIFEVTSIDEYYQKLNEINDIKEEIYKRLNVFSETLEKGNTNG